MQCTHAIHVFLCEFCSARARDEVQRGFIAAKEGFENLMQICEISPKLKRTAISRCGIGKISARAQTLFNFIREFEKPQKSRSRVAREEHEMRVAVGAKRPPAAMSEEKRLFSQATRLEMKPSCIP